MTYTMSSPKRNEHDDAVAFWVANEGRFPSIEMWVSAPAKLGHLAVLRDKDEAPCGMLTWANLADHRAEQMRESDVFALHISEWNEGLHTWMISGYLSSRDAIYPARQRLRQIARNFGQVSYVRERKSGRVVRVVRSVAI